MNSSFVCAKRISVYALFAILLFLAKGSYSQSAAEGRSLFYEQKKCNICHTIGGGKLIGPDLKGVVDRREHEWLVRHIVEPDKMTAERDPIVMQLLKEHNNAVMPVFGLSRAQAESIIAFLSNPETSAEAAQPDSTAPPFSIKAVLANVDDAEIVAKGQKYFMGELKFANGAPPCFSCHHVAQSGLFGGGSLGPDLSPAYQKFTEPGLASLLQSIAYPTMQPVFKDKPLTDEEIAYIVGYLKSAGQKRAMPVGANISLFIVLTFIALIFISPMIWSNRLGAVRKKLVRGN